MPALPTDPADRTFCFSCRKCTDGAENVPDAFIANLLFNERDGAAWLKLSASEDGSFTVTNRRTGWTKNYGASGIP